MDDSMDGKQSKYPGIYPAAALLCCASKIHVATPSLAFQALRKRNPSDAPLALWALARLLDLVIRRGRDTQLSSTQFRRFLDNWDDIRWWITTFLDEYVLRIQDRSISPDEVDCQTKILIIIPELTVYLDLAVTEAFEDKIRNVLKEDFGPLLQLAVRTWIYVLDNCSRDIRESHCAAMICLFKKIPDPIPIYRRVGDVLEQMPGSERIILRSIVQELQLLTWNVENLSFALHVIIECAHYHDTMFNRFLVGGMVRWLCWSFKKMTFPRLLCMEISTDDEYLRAIAICVQCLGAAFVNSYNWIPLAINYDFLKAVIQSGLFVEKRRSTPSGVILEASLRVLFEKMKPFLLFRSVLRPFLRFVKSARRQQPELYKQFTDMSLNVEHPKICFPTVWKEFLALAEERQESRRMATKEGGFLCSYLDCSSDSSSVKLKQCSHCRTILYCSKHCQKRDWSEHREECEVARSRTVSGGRPAPDSQFDQDFFIFLTEDRGRRLLSSPQIERFLKVDPNGFDNKIITLDFRENPPIMMPLTFEQYRINIGKSNWNILTPGNYNELVEEAETEYTLLLQGIFPGEDGAPESVVTSVMDDAVEEAKWMVSQANDKIR